jgi:Icc-related predicted phosphoesterase
MKVFALSDIHGYLPKVPECDILLLAGDYEPGMGKGRDREWLLGPFADWLRGLPARHVIGVAGNHDFEFQRHPEAYRGLPWHYLENSGIELDGLTFWGSPWTPPFFNWAFMAEEDKLRSMFAKIPKHVDVLITHGPPAGILDRNYHGHGCGSTALSGKVLKVAPRLHVFGHIHESFGRHYLNLGNPKGGTVFANVAYVNGQYAPVRDVALQCDFSEIFRDD